MLGRSTKIERDVIATTHEMSTPQPADTSEQLQIAMYNADAAAALADTAHSKVRRIAAKWGIRTAGGLAAIGMGGYGASQTFDKFGDFVDKFASGGVVHEAVIITPENAIDKLSFPGKTIYVQGEGTGSAQVQARPQSDIPLIGSIYNSLYAPFQDKSTVVGRRAAAQIGTRLGAITKSLYEVPGTRADDKIQYGLQLNVNVAGLFTQVITEADRDADGKSKVDTDDDLLVRESRDDTANRGITVADLAGDEFRKSCSRKLKYVLPYSIKKFARTAMNDEIIFNKAIANATKQATADAQQISSKYNQVPHPGKIY